MTPFSIVLTNLNHVTELAADIRNTDYMRSYGFNCEAHDHDLRLCGVQMDDVMDELKMHGLASGVFFDQLNKAAKSIGWCDYTTTTTQNDEEFI